MEKYHYIINVEAVIYREEDYKWLITQRSEQEDHAAGMLSFVGGKVEDISQVNDILEASLKREVKEEVGVDIEIIKYLESSAFTSDDDREIVSITLLCKYKKGQAKPIDTDEIAEVHWLTTEEVLNNPKAPEWTKRNIKKAAHKIKTLT